ncbi:hypothetical protein LTR95_001518 [Oleoguttula sp. CCFEE 5521]
MNIPPPKSTGKWATVTYSFGSLNGTVSYENVIGSMIYWLRDRMGMFDTKTIISLKRYEHKEITDMISRDLIMVVSKAEEWSSMGMAHLSQQPLDSVDARLFDSAQIKELTVAGGYEQMIETLGVFWDTNQLRYTKQ